MRVGIIGIGTVGQALARGFLRAGIEDLAGTTAHPASAERARRALGIPVSTDNRALVCDRDILILAVKPSAVAGVVGEIAPRVTPHQTLVTLAAATPTARVEGLLGSGVSVIRAMPNTPCAVGAGMTVLCPGRSAGPDQLSAVQALFATVGRVALVEDEDLMSVVTALSGSGPAYTFIILEALSEGGVKMGLPRALATELAAQALLGGAALALESGQHPALLKADVTTPAGVTIDGLLALEEGGVRVSLIKAVMAATERSAQLASLLDRDAFRPT